MWPIYNMRRWLRAGTRIDLNAIADIEVHRKMRIAAGIVGNDIEFQLEITKKYGRRSVIRKSDKLQRKARRAEKRGNIIEAKLLREQWNRLVAHECNWVNAVVEQEKQGLRSNERKEKGNRLNLWLTLLNLIILTVLGFDGRVLALIQSILRYWGLQ